MSYAEELGKEISISRDALLKAIVQSKDRAELGKRNADKLVSIDKDLEHYMFLRNDLKNTINHVVREYKNIEQYLIDKKENSMEMLELAVDKAGYIVPDSDTDGIHLKIGDKSAKVVNRLGQDINLREGSAFRTVMGMLMRYTLIKFQPNSLQVIWLDEAFSTLSDETATIMREYIEAFSQDVLVVGIEQHNVMFEGMEKTTYRVLKGENKETIIRQE